jgi:Holliday junction DNA helicase RuvA
VISHLRGVLVEKSPAGVVVEVGGIGLALAAPLSTVEKIPDEGREVFLHTYLHVREDLLALYGFATRDERDLFLALIGVSGVGPKIALALLSGARPERLRAWIRDEQPGPLTKIPGVGRKTAERIIVELKERVGSLPAGSAGGGAGGVGEEAALALDALGVKEARDRVAAVLRGAKAEELTAEEIVRRALAGGGR